MNIPPKTLHVWSRAAAAAVLGATFSGGAAAQEGGFSFEPRGRIQIDAQSRDWALRDEDDTDVYIRRLFLGAQGRIAGPWRYKADFVLTPGIDHIGVDDAFIEYRAANWSVFVGQHNITTPLEERTSSLDTPFIERSSVINAFGYGRRAGLGFITAGAQWSAALAIQGGSMSAAEGEGDVDESRALSGRFTMAPINRDGAVLHLGLNGRHRYQHDAPQRVRTRPLNGRDSRWIDAASLSANRLDHDLSLGAEIGLVRGAFALVGEYIAMDGETAFGEGRRFSGFYVDAAWSLTGEALAYNPRSGLFGAATPAAPLGQGGWGYWALSVRHDYIDLTDGADPQRGEQRAYALGLDWIPVERVRVKLNYAHSEMDRTIGPDDEADIASLRLQFHF